MKRSFLSFCLLVMSMAIFAQTPTKNDLIVVEKFLPISARLIVNKSSFKFKTEEIEKIAQGLRVQVESND